MIKVIVVKNYEELSNKAYDVMKQTLLNENAVLGLATGSSPIGLYKNMIEDYKNSNVSYKNIVTFNLDEYANLDKNHSQSYYTFMHDNLFKHIDINLDNVHIPSGNGDLETNCLNYDKQMEKYNIDIQVLGIGSNGHIGFNEPFTPFDSVTHVVKLKESTRKDNARFFEPLNEEVPTHACTMGISSIMKSKQILLIASGEKKAQAINNMINGPIDESCPASILQQHDNVVVIIDEKAASLL